MNTQGKVHLAIFYLKPTHTDQFLSFNSNHYLKNKRSAERALLHGAVHLDREEEEEEEDRERRMQHVQQVDEKPQPGRTLLNRRGPVEVSHWDIKLHLLHTTETKSAVSVYIRH